MKKRTISLASAALLVVGLFGTSVVSATPTAGISQGAGNCVAGTPTATPTPTPTPSTVAGFRAKVTPGHICGKVVVHAKVLHPDRLKTFSASATAHFVRGDVTVPLRRAGKSFVAIGKIRVPAGEPAGYVKVDVTITYGGVVQPVITTVTEIKAP